MERQVDVVEKALVPRHAVGSGLGQRLLRVDEADTGLAPRHLAHDRVRARVGAEAEGVEIARLREETAGLVVPAQARRLPAAVVDLRRLGGGERPAVPEVHGHRAQDHRHAHGPRQAAGVGQVALVVAVRPLERRVPRPHLPLEEHLHAVPGARRLPASQALPRGAGDAPHELAETRAPHRDGRAHDRQRWRRRGEHGARAVGSDDLVVAGVDDEEIGLEPEAGAGRGVGEVRVDGGRRRARHLECDSGVLVAEQDLEHPGDAEAGLGVALRRRAAQDEHAVRPRRLRHGKGEGRGDPGDARLEEEPREARVAQIARLALDLLPQGEVHRHAVSGETEQKLEDEQDEEGEENEDGPEEPETGAGGSLVARRDRSSSG